MSDAIAVFVDRYLEAASDEHYATLMAPEQTRLATAAVFAYYAHIRRLLAIQADVAPQKISWWHDALAALREQRAVHPVLEPLLPHVSEPLIDDLNALLHGAVMDFNRVEVDGGNLTDYLRLRAGALHALLARIEQREAPADALAALGRAYGLSTVMIEAREPAFADQPVAPISLPDTHDDASMLAALSQYVMDARDDAANARCGVASHVLMSLRLAHWPAIAAGAFGETLAPLPVWRKLFVAWRAARRA